MRLRRAVWALFRRDFAELSSYKAAGALELAAIAAHALVFFFVAKLIPDAAGSALADFGGRYFPFALAGLAFTNYHAAALNGFAHGLGREIDDGTIELIWM